MSTAAIPPRRSCRNARLSSISKFEIDEVAILGEFSDQRIDLPESQLRATLQITAHVSVRRTQIKVSRFLRSSCWWQVPGDIVALHGVSHGLSQDLARAERSRYGGRRRLTDRIVPLLKNGGRIVLFVLNHRVVDKGGEFGRNVTFQSSRFVRSSAVPTEIHFVPSNLARRWGRLGLSKVRRLMNRMMWLTAPLTGLALHTMDGLGLLPLLVHGEHKAAVQQLLVDGRSPWS